MTSRQAFLELSQLVNRSTLGSNRVLSIDWFVSTYNREAQRWLVSQLNRKSDSQASEDLQELLVFSKNLPVLATEKDYTEYSLPADYYTIEHIKAIANNSCSTALVCRPVKTRNLSELFADPLNSPSLLWRETFYTLTSNKLRVYKKDFELKNLQLTYYRMPGLIDLQGYIHIDKIASVTIDPDLSDVYCRQILDRVAAEFFLQQPSQEFTQTSQTRLAG